LVLYAGCIMELADVETLYKNPQHPYTKNLLEAVPLADPRQERQRLKNRAGKQSLNSTSTEGCAYFSRCPEADQQCGQQPPQLRAVADSHLVACHKR